MKKSNNSNTTVIDQYGSDIANAYYRNCRSGVYRRDNIDLASPQATNLYNGYITSVINANPIEYKKKHFKELEVDDIIDEVLNILIYLLGPKFFKQDECFNFFKAVEQTDSEDILDGICLITLNANGKKDYHVKVARLDSISSVIALTHEFIHYYLHLHDIAYVDHKFYYEEIMSILAEKIACEILTSDGVGDITKKIENTRLEVISWHYNAGLQGYNEAVNVHNFLKGIAMINSRVKSDLERMEKDIPWLRSEVQTKRYLEYAKALRESYGLGYLYAENLFQKCLDNPTNIQKIQGILQGECIGDTLKYFGIKSDDEKTYEVARQKIKRMCE